MLALRTQQSSANSFSPGAVGAANLADTSAWRAPGPVPVAGGDKEASPGGGILGAILGSGVGAASAADFPNPPPQAAPFAPAMTADQLEWGVPTRHTVAVAHTDVPGLERLKFEGGSPLVRDDAGWPRATAGPIHSPSKLPRDRGHAEEDVANQFIRVVERRRLAQSDLDGRTLTIRTSMPACPTCRSGLDSEASPGVLKQLSERYPGLTIVVESEVDMGAPMVRGIESFAIKGGRYIRRAR